MEARKFALDDEAESLFSALGGIDTSDRSLRLVHNAIPLIDEEEQLDQVRLLLQEFVYELASYLEGVRYLEGIQHSEKKAFSKIVNVLNQLAKLPNPEGSLEIRYRGYPTGKKMSSSLDYVVLYGDVALDLSLSTSMAHRLGLQYSHLPRQLEKAYEIFSSRSINTLHLDLSSSDQPNRIFWEHIWVCLSILSRYHLALKRNSPITFESSQRVISISIIPDEKGLPDPNLTLTVGVNNLDAGFIKGLVEKVDAWRKRASETTQTDQLISVYNAIFAIPSLKSKLIKPPVEINNVKWMLMNGNADQPLSAQKAGVGQLIMQKFSNSPQIAAKAVNSVYGDDYRRIDTVHFAERMKITAHLLSHFEKTPDEAGLTHEILNNIKNRVEQVDDDIFENIKLNNDQISIQTDKKETIVNRIPEKLFKIIGFYQKRSISKKKIKQIIRQKIDFDNQDYEVLARDFGVSVPKIKHLVELLKACFDDRGRFLRSVFENNISEFVKYEEKVFSFLWFFLKETPHRNDRVAFLNSLQNLVLKMKQPDKAVKSLLDELFDDPALIRYSDRNSFMLMNLLLRIYNQDSHLDIEMTPEDVLQIQIGLNANVVSMARRMLEKKRGALEIRLESMHELLREAFQKGTAGKDSMSSRFLMLLERETLIFLSLVGGKAARSAIRSSIRFHTEMIASESHFQIENLLQHLRILIRCLYRIAEKEDIPLFEAILDRKDALIRMKKDSGYRDRVDRLLKWVNLAIKQTLVNPIKEQRAIRQAAAA